MENWHHKFFPELLGDVCILKQNRNKV